MEGNYVGGNSTYIPNSDLVKKRKKKKPLSFTTEDGWSIARNVAVFSIGKVNNIEVTIQDLINIVEAAKSRELDTGDAPVIFCGHNTPERGDEKQVCGFLKNLHIAPFKKEQIPALFADLWIFEEEQDVLRKYPRRSAEWNQDSNHFSLALLGGTEPAFDLSLTFAKKPAQQRIQLSDIDIIRSIMLDQSISYEKAVDIRLFQLDTENHSTDPNKDKNMNKTNIMELIEEFSQKMNMILSVIDGDEELEKEELMEEKEEEVKSEDESNDEDESDDEDESNDEDAPDQDSDSNEENKEDEDEEEDEDKFEQRSDIDDAHVIGLTPTSDKDLEMKKHNSNEERLQFSLDKSESDLDEMRKEIADLKNDVSQTDKERKLVDLNRTFKFNLKSEIDLVRDYNIEQFAGHVAIIEGNYQKLPVGLSPVALSTKAPTSTPQTFSALDRDKCVKLAAEKGITFDQARKTMEEE